MEGGKEDNYLEAREKLVFSFSFLGKKRRYLETEGTSDLFALGHANGKSIRVRVLNFDQELP